MYPDRAVYPDSAMHPDRTMYPNTPTPPERYASPGRPTPRRARLIALLAVALTAAALFTGVMPASAQPYRAGYGITITRNAERQPVWSVNMNDISDSLRTLLGIGCYKLYSVPLGYWGKQRVERRADALTTICDTTWWYPLPRVRDTSYITADLVQMLSMQLDQYATLGIYRDTVRTSPLSRVTVSFVRDAGSGLYVANMKETNAGYAHRIGQHGSVFGLGYYGCPIVQACGGRLLARDTVTLWKSSVIAWGLNNPAAWNRQTIVDTALQIVTDVERYRALRDGKLVYTLANCGPRPTVITVFTEEPVWIPSGRDSLVAVDTCAFRCPTFYVDAAFERTDTLMRIDTVRTDIPVYAFDTTIVPNCTKAHFIPTQWRVEAQVRNYRVIDYARFTALKGTWGCDTSSVQPRRAVLDSLIYRHYDKTGTFLYETRKAPTALGEQAFWCDTTGVGAPPVGWHRSDSTQWVSASLSNYGTVIGTIAVYSKYCFLPLAALSPDTAACGDFLAVVPTGYTLQFGACCEKDSTVTFSRPSVKDPTRTVFGSYTFKIPDGNYCTFQRIDSFVVGYTIARLDTVVYTETHPLDTLQYTITVSDSCECSPAIDLVNGTVELCEPIRIRMECTQTQPYWDGDGRTIVIPCQDHRIWINGRRSSWFDDILTTTDYTLLVEMIRAYYDSARIAASAVCPPCVDSLRASIDSLRTRIDSLEARVDSLESERWVCATTTLGSLGTPASVSISMAEPAAVQIVYKGSGTRTYPLSWDYAGGELIIYGDSSAEIQYCYRAQPPPGP